MVLAWWLDWSQKKFEHIRCAQCARQKPNVLRAQTNRSPGQVGQPIGRHSELPANRIASTQMIINAVCSTLPVVDWSIAQVTVIKKYFCSHTTAKGSLNKQQLLPPFSSLKWARCYRAIELRKTTSTLNGNGSHMQNISYFWELIRLKLKPLTNSVSLLRD